MIKKATMADAKQLHMFLQQAAESGEILPRPMHDLYQFIRDYWIYREKKSGPIRAVSSLHICWEDLGEIRNLYVEPKHRSNGMGEELVGLAMEEAKELGIKKLFALTYRPEFFKRLGFRDVDKNTLPMKVWADCLSCMKFPECDEQAVMFVRGKNKFTRRKKKN